MKTTHHGITLCPSCGATLDASTEVNREGAAPVPGDLSVCAHCQQFLTFCEDLVLRVLSASEEENLPEETRLVLKRVRNRLASRSIRSVGGGIA